MKIDSFIKSLPHPIEAVTQAVSSAVGFFCSAASYGTSTLVSLASLGSQSKRVSWHLIDTFLSFLTSIFSAFRCPYPKDTRDFLFALLKDWTEPTPKTPKKLSHLVAYLHMCLPRKLPQNFAFDLLTDKLEELAFTPKDRQEIERIFLQGDLVDEGEVYSEKAKALLELRIQFEELFPEELRSEWINTFCKASQGGMSYPEAREYLLDQIDQLLSRCDPFPQVKGLICEIRSTLCKYYTQEHLASQETLYKIWTG